ncbi:MAG: rhomboid family intramembrane serine protease [Chloroherpetonaceae bacterium]|nr:rhomboid family intramembrane serine protease [Chthonomonadaceae bacterium]MDW8208166.1 rhomboid family intramembrane serine protease [Chloroherpetonaceae bacterium]
MIPLTDRNPTRHFPVICVVLILINTLVFLYDTFTPVLIERIAANPYGVPVRVRDTVGILTLRYALVPAYVTGLPPDRGAALVLPQLTHPAWLTVFTSMFLHASWLHIGGNMLYLWVFGNNIEDVLGRARFVMFYLLSGVGAAAVHIASDPTSTVPTVGASGAVAGLMGAYLLLYPHARILSIVPLFGILSTLMEVPAVLVIGFWVLLQVLHTQLFGGEMLTRGGGVAYLAHIGGFVTGALLILLMGGRRLLNTRPQAADYPYPPEPWP